MAMLYIVAQLLGALLAAYALKALFPSDVATATRLGGQALALDVTVHAGRLPRSDRHLLPRVRRVRHRGRSARAEGRRLRDRTDGDGGHPGDRSAHRRVDESGAVARPRRGERAVRGAGRLLDRPDPRRDRGGAVVRQPLPAPREGEARCTVPSSRKVDDVRELRSSDRSTALRRGVLFIVATSPIWLMPRRFPVFHPVAMLGVVLGVTLLFLWWDNRSPSELGLELSWRRRPANLLGGLVGGALLIAVIAVLLHAILPFDWAFNATFIPRLRGDRACSTCSSRRASRSCCSAVTASSGSSPRSGSGRRSSSSRCCSRRTTC